MFLHHPEHQIVNMEHIAFIKKDWLMKADNYVIQFYGTSGAYGTTWKFGSREARDMVFDAILRQLGSVSVEERHQGDTIVFSGKSE